MAAASSLSTAPRAPLAPALAFFGTASNRFGAACVCVGEPGFSLAEAKKIYVGGRNAWNPWGPGVRKWKGPHKVFRGDTLVVPIIWVPLIGQSKSGFGWTKGKSAK
ncbi:unnamed protein product [Closterium sp. NIES-64]|nr:unnamed protein product [Closterium sp. NIES-64]